MHTNHLRLLSIALTLASLVGAGCARRALPGAPLDPAALSAAAPAPWLLEGPLTFERALTLAVEHDPELAALRAGIEGAGAWPPAGPLGLSLGADSSGRPEGGLTLDLLSVLGQGPRRAERVLARLRRDEATRELEARAREMAREVAEAFALEAVLSQAAPGAALLDPQAFVAAGLAPAAAQASADAARRSLEAEEHARLASLRAAHARLALHLGADPALPLRPVVPAGAWPAVPEPLPAALLATQPEVTRRLAAYEVARGEALRALALRDPGLELNPSLALDPTHFFGAVSLRLPLDAGGEVRAAHARMESARLAVKAALLEAQAEAHAARAVWQGAEAQAQAADARLVAATALAAAERARVEAQGEGFTEAVLAVNAVVDAQRALREARVEAARARVGAAWAAGWPAPNLAALPPLGAAAPTR